MLEQKRIEAIDLNNQTFSPQHLMVYRDVEKEKLIRSNKFYDMIMAEWNNKSKEEKQEFISKFLESITIEKDKDVRATIMMGKQELQDYINDYYEVSYYEIARLDEPKKGYQKKYLTIDEINENGEKLFKLVELITDDKKFPQKKANRIVGAIRVKEREKVS